MNLKFLISSTRLYSLIKSWSAIFLYHLQLLRLRCERLCEKLPGRNQRPRVMATACWEFPIYSQTFVYQELTQLSRPSFKKNKENRNGFKLRFLYYHRNRQNRMPKQFFPLWRARCRVILHPRVCQSALAYFQKRLPEKVEALLALLSNTSGIPRQDLLEHKHFLQAMSVARVIAAYRPDYLHTYFFYEGTLFGLIASYLLHIPRGVSCYTDHNLQDYELKLVPLHVETCDVVVATSKHIKRELMTFAPHVDPDRIIVKPNAVNAAHFPSASRNEPQKGEPYQLVCVSRIEPKKGITYLAEAVHALHQKNINVVAHCLGGVDANPIAENYARELRERMAALQLNGSFVLAGRKPEAEIRQFLAGAHLFVAPFIETDAGDKDGIPTALLEAMATGLPAIATDAGSISEVIDHGHDGLMVPQRDAAALASSIADLIHDRQRRIQMGQNAARKIRAHFDVSVCEPLFHQRILEVVRRTGND